MKKLNHLRIVISMIITISLLISCRSSEDIRLDRFLGVWNLQSTCTQLGPQVLSTITSSTVTIGKAKPDGIWFTAPTCGTSQISPIYLYLQFNSKTKSYNLVFNSNNHSDFMKGLGSPGDIPLTYSEENGFAMKGVDEDISIKWEGNVHTWIFSKKEPNGQFT